MILSLPSSFKIHCPVKHSNKVHLPNVRALKKAIQITKINKQFQQIETIIQDSQLKAYSSTTLEHERLLKDPKTKTSYLQYKTKQKMHNNKLNVEKEKETEIIETTRSLHSRRTIPIDLKMFSEAGLNLLKIESKKKFDPRKFDFEEMYRKIKLEIETKPKNRRSFSEQSSASENKKREKNNTEDSYQSSCEETEDRIERIHSIHKSIKVSKSFRTHRNLNSSRI